MNKEPVALYLNRKRSMTNVTWNITMRCNIDCSYCVRDIRHNFTAPHPDLATAKQMVDVIHNQYEKVEWGLTGGEPMTIPHIGDIVEYIANKENSLATMVSNGIVSANKFIELLDRGLEALVISVHYEYIFGKEDYYIQQYKEINDYINNYNSQHENKKKFIIRIMLYPGCFVEHVKMAEQLKTLGIKNIEFRPLGLLVSHVYRGQEVLTTKERIKEKYDKTPHMFLKEAAERKDWYTSEEQDQYTAIMKKESDQTLQLCYNDNKSDSIHYNELLLNLTNRFKGWKCYLGNQVIIDFNGDIYRSNCQIEGPVGNMHTITKDYKIPQTVYMCNKEYCNDYCDLQISKVKPGYESLLEKDGNSE